MWILIEDQRMINVELITDVVFREHGRHAGTASAFCAGVIVASDSEAVYKYFKSVQAGPNFHTPPSEPTNESPQSSQSPQAQPEQEN